MKRFISLFLLVMFVLSINVGFAQESYEDELTPELPANVDVDGEESEEAEE